MTQREFVIWLLFGLLAFMLIGGTITGAIYLADKERDARERLESNKPRKIWERK